MSQLKTVIDFETLKAELKKCRQQVDSALKRYLPSEDMLPRRLHQAMHYSVFNGGKRVRPALVYMTGMALGVDLNLLDAPAAAVECIHAYSLIHDDLPAMDDDDLRRGKPTCHRAFDEATAILAGDGLQALAFHVLAHDSKLNIPADTRIEMLEQLALASGSRGMVGGQAIDIDAIGQELDIAQLENMHIHKTGALIRASVMMGALGSPELTDEQAKKLDHYSKCIGLSFQIQDDILDVEGDAEELGKAVGADGRLSKPSYPSILGLDQSRVRARELTDDALESLADFDERADFLRVLAEYIISRRN